MGGMACCLSFGNVYDCFTRKGYYSASGCGVGAFDMLYNNNGTMMIPTVLDRYEGHFEAMLLEIEWR